MKNYYIFQNNKKSALFCTWGNLPHVWRGDGGSHVPAGVGHALGPPSTRGGTGGTEAKDTPELIGTRHCPGGPGVPWTAP